MLGAILADGDCFFRVVDILKAEDFYLRNHQETFKAFAQLANENQDIDLVTTNDCLQRRGALDDAGGVEYLASLSDELPDPASVEYYARIVRDRSLKRELLRLSQTMLAMAARDEGEALDVLDAAESQILTLAERATRGGLVPVSSLVTNELQHIEQVSRQRAPYTGLETGFFRLDELTSGLQKQELIILAARPGIGKTALALNIAANVALRRRLNVALFSLEMSGVALVRRLLAAEARINLRRLTRGLLSRRGSDEPSDWDRLVEAADLLADAPLWIDDTAAITILELRGACRRLAMERGLDLVVVDYLQLMSSGVKAENRTQEVSAISRGLKALAKQLNVPMLVLSQLSRNPERRGGDHRPQLSDLRESGSIEQDADVVLFINRRNPALSGGSGGNEDDGDDLRLAEIVVAKQRNGPTDTFKLVYFDEFTRFENPDYGDAR